MYLIVFVFLLVFSLFEVVFVAKKPKIFHVFFIVLVSMLIFRFGQGTDYFAYINMYDEIQYNTSDSVLGIFKRSDFGFNFLIYIFICLNIGPELSIAFIGLISMIILYPFFVKYCRYSILALFIFYTAFFLIYQFSGIRQGLALAIALGGLLPLLLKGCLFRYFVVLAISSSIHLSSLILIILPIVIKFKFSNSKETLIVLVATVLIFTNIDLIFIFSKLALTERLGFYIDSEGSENAIFAKLFRLILIIPILVIPNRVYSNSQQLDLLKKILISGYVVYAMFNSSELISSRLAVYFKVFEILFYASLLFESDLKRLNKQICVYIMLCFTILYFHNINGMIGQGDYKSCNIFTYPYVSVFESESELFLYRKNY